MIEGLYIDQQPLACHAQPEPIAMPMTSASGGIALFEAIAADAHVRTLMAEAVVDDGTCHWTADEFQLMHAACVQMLTPPEGEAVDDADMVELDQPNANAGGSGAASYIPSSFLESAFRPACPRERFDYAHDQTARCNSWNTMGQD